MILHVPTDACSLSGTYTQRSRRTRDLVNALPPVASLVPRRIAGISRRHTLPAPFPSESGSMRYPADTDAVFLPRLSVRGLPHSAYRLWPPPARALPSVQVRAVLRGRTLLHAEIGPPDCAVAKLPALHYRISGSCQPASQPTHHSTRMVSGLLLIAIVCDSEQVGIKGRKSATGCWVIDVQPTRADILGAASAVSSAR